jgi:hypothetical protein
MTHRIDSRGTPLSIAFTPVPAFHPGGTREQAPGLGMSRDAKVVKVVFTVRKCCFLISGWRK